MAEYAEQQSLQSGDISTQKSANVSNQSVDKSATAKASKKSGNLLVLVLISKLNLLWTYGSVSSFCFFHIV
jgi:hypothetical protein